MHETLLENIKQNPKLVVAQDYEISVQSWCLESLNYIQGESRESGEELGLWIGLRILHRNRGGFSSTRLCHPEALHALVDQAFQSAEVSQPDPWFRLPFWRKEQTKTLTAVPKSVPRKSFYSEDLGEGLEGFEVTESHEDLLIKTTLQRRMQEAVSYEERRASVKFSVKAYDPSEGRVEIVDRMSEQRASRERLETLVRKLKNLIKATPYETTADFQWGLSPKVASEILSRQAGHFSASFKKDRPETWKLKTKVFSPAISLVDDPRLDQGMVSRPFDLEGVPSQKTVLIKKGVLETYLHDSYTAGKENRLSTGNRVRPLDSLEPKTGTTNFYIEAGELDPAEWVKQVKKGIYVEDVYATPQSSIVPKEDVQGFGWLIEDGAVVRAVKGIKIQWEAPEILMAADGVGKDLDFQGSFGSPSIFLKKIPIRQ